MRRMAPWIVSLGFVFIFGAGPMGIAANDTGGIIPWSPENQRNAVTIASELCARYNKYARITSVHATFGDYIGFSCVWSPHARP
jgi:hypothetical protein